MSITKTAGKSGSRIKFESGSSLDRHRWFERAHASSGWASRVRADRLQIERQREEQAHKQAEESARKNVEKLARQKREDAVAPPPLKPQKSASVRPLREKIASPPPKRRRRSDLNGPSRLRSVGQPGPIARSQRVGRRRPTEQTFSNGEARSPPVSFLYRTQPA